MLKKLMLPLIAALILAPAANAQVSLDTPVLDVDLGTPAVDVDLGTPAIRQDLTLPAVTTTSAGCPTVITQPAVTCPVLQQSAVVAPACPTVLTQPAVVATPMEYYQVTEHPAVISQPVMSTTCPGVIEHSAVITQPRTYGFMVPAPRGLDIDDDDDDGIFELLNPFEWFDDD